MKNTYWIADTEGVKACVVGANVRDQWVRVHGWSETTEPTGLEFQWIRNVDHGGRGVMNHEAAVLHVGLGWVPSDPPPPPGMPSLAVEPDEPAVSTEPAPGETVKGSAANG